MRPELEADHWRLSSARLRLKEAIPALPWHGDNCNYAEVLNPCNCIHIPSSKSSKSSSCELLGWHRGYRSFWISYRLNQEVPPKYGNHPPDYTVPKPTNPQKRFNFVCSLFNSYFIITFKKKPSLRSTPTPDTWHRVVWEIYANVLNKFIYHNMFLNPSPSLKHQIPFTDPLNF